MTTDTDTFVDQLDATPATRKSTRDAWNRYRQWCADMGLSPNVANAATLVLYLTQRGLGEWRPPGGKKTGVKYNTLITYRAGIIRAWEWAGHDVTAIHQDHNLVNLIANLQARREPELNRTQTARPLTERHLRKLTATLERLRSSGRVSAFWAASWRARILLGAAGGLRISELLRMETTWLHPINDADDPRLLVVVPRSKYQPEPRTVVIVPRGDDLCPLAALLEWFDTASQIEEWKEITKVFPTVAKVAPRPPVPAPPPSVRGMRLADFPHLVAELADDLDPASLAAGSTRKVGWKCDAGHEWIAPIQRRTGEGSGCPVCRRGGAHPTDHTGQPREMVDAIADKLANPEFHPDEDQAMRGHHALRIVVNGENEHFKTLCADAGIEHGDFERLTSHALRKTTGTQMANDGKTLAEISRHLRHRHEKASLPYIVPAHLTHPPITADLPGW